MDCLPNELIQIIFQYLARPALKNTRTQNKRCASIGEPLLFRELHLSPNNKSFERARELVFTRPDLAHYVKIVIYHVNNYTVHISAFNSYRETFTDTQDTDTLYKDFLRHHQDDLDLNCKPIERRFLESILSRLESLEAVKVLDEWNYKQNDYGDDFVRRAVRNRPQAYRRAGHHLAMVITAAGSKPLKSIQAKGIHMGTLREAIYPHIGLRDLKNLEQLELIFRDRVDTNGTWIPEGFHLLPDSTANLRCLSFHLNWPHEQGVCRASAALLSAKSWTKLQYLSLQGISVEEDHLLQFFAAHTDSLRTLDLCNIDFHVGSEKPGSIKSLFTGLHQYTMLDEVRLRGVFRSFGKEAWYAPQEEEYQVRLIDCIRKRIENYLAHKGEYPFLTEDESWVSRPDLSRTSRLDLPWPSFDME